MDIDTVCATVQLRDTQKYEMYELFGQRGAACGEMVQLANCLCAIGGYGEPIRAIHKSSGLIQVEEDGHCEADHLLLDGAESAVVTGVGMAV